MKVRELILKLLQFNADADIAVINLSTTSQLPGTENDILSIYGQATKTARYTNKLFIAIKERTY